MPVVNVLDAEVSSEAIRRTETRPRPASYDSGEEFSVDHLRELYRLLEFENHELEQHVFSNSCLYGA